jgi:hypothetical protein
MVEGVVKVVVVFGEEFGVRSSLFILVSKVTVRPSLLPSISHDVSLGMVSLGMVSSVL